MLRTDRSSANFHEPSILRRVTQAMRITKALFLLALPLALTGCPSTGVGDPCTPESTPEGGFQASETYLETSSVQCRTRVCMVYKLNGDPTLTVQECIDGGQSSVVCTELYPSEIERTQRVFCTCRCGTTGGADDGTPLCECGEGFVCSDDPSLGSAAGPILTQGGVGIRGSYCLRADLVNR